MLVARGYVPVVSRNATGDTALWLVAIGRGSRPARWDEGIAQALAHRIPYVRELALDRMPADVPASLIDAIGASLNSNRDVDVQIAACRLVERARIAALRAPVIAVLQAAKDSWLVGAAASALFAIGAIIDEVTVLATRLPEPDLTDQMLGVLVGLLDSTGSSSSGSITADRARVLSQRWLVFITAHRADIEANRRISLDAPDIPIDLVPSSWTVHRAGKPDWPPPGR
jgi:hypothetical protein